MTVDKNIFGGGNNKSLYVPLSELEQESIARLVESGDLYVDIVDWGIHTKPKITYGDARVCVEFMMNFVKPAIPQPCTHFDLELRTHSGRLIFKDHKSIQYDGKPMMIGAGLSLGMQWHIAIRSIDPQLVKDTVTGAIGLTSRLQDRDTGAFTLEGNMKLTAKQRQALRLIRRGEAFVRKMDQNN